MTDTNFDTRPVMDPERDAGRDPSEFHNDGQPVMSPSAVASGAPGPSGAIPAETTDVDTPLLHQADDGWSEAQPESASVDVDDMTYDELRELAAQQGVSGRASMSKAELQEALR